MAQQLWWYQQANDILGPYTSGQMKQLVRDHILLPTQSVSLDRVSWVSASRVQGLFSTVGPRSYDVFISHSTSDKALASSLCQFLEHRGIRCWIAPRDVQPGEKWATAVMNAIRSCRVMVLLLTKHSNVSQQVSQEVERATFYNRNLITLRLDDVQPIGDLEYFLCNRHWLDAIAEPRADRYGELAESILQIVGPREKRQTDRTNEPHTAQHEVPRQSMKDTVLDTPRKDRNLARTETEIAADFPSASGDSPPSKESRTTAFGDALSEATQKNETVKNEPFLDPGDSQSESGLGLGEKAADFSSVGSRVPLPTDIDFSDEIPQDLLREASQVTKKQIDRLASDIKIQNESPSTEIAETVSRMRTKTFPEVHPVFEDFFDKEPETRDFHAGEIAGESSATSGIRPLVDTPLAATNAGGFQLRKSTLRWASVAFALACVVSGIAGYASYRSANPAVKSSSAADVVDAVSADELLRLGADWDEYNRTLLNAENAEPFFDKHESSRLQAWKKLANANNPKAMVLAAHHLRKRIRTVDDTGEVVKIYEKAAALGEPAAMYNLGHCYLKGFEKKIGIDLIKAQSWCLRAAEYDHPSALNDLASFHWDIDPKNRRVDLARKYLLKSHDLGCVMAKYNMAICILKGELDFAKDPAKAISLLKSLRGSQCPSAVCALGELYYEGFEPFLVKNEDEARKLFENGCEYDHIDSLRWLGIFYYNKNRGSEDRVLACKYLERAALKEDTESMYLYGLCLENKWIGVDAKNSNHDYLMWYRRAAKAKNQNAIDRLDEIGKQ